MTVRKDESLDAEKRAMRARIRGRLDGIAGVRARVSAAMVGSLVGSDVWRGAGSVMAYLATEREPDLDGLWAVEPRPILSAPRVDWDGGTMSCREVGSVGAGLAIRRHGVREPGSETALVDPAALDVVLVPGLAFDAGGGRLGQGGGFYDRFLPGATRARLVGVCWSGCVVDRVPAGPGDVRVHMLLTERGLVSCGGPGALGG